MFICCFLAFALSVRGGEKSPLVKGAKLQNASNGKPLHVKQYRKDGRRHAALQEQNIVAGIDVQEAASFAVLLPGRGIVAGCAINRCCAAP
ncbi:MAG: hypothetical protein JO239_04760 [Paraburkholderia sp.]|nr:hypothetical protein [Paraburkholderia sp.]